MSLRFDDRAVLVTGAGRGLGRAYAVELARRGASVVVNDIGAALDGSETGEAPSDEVVAEIVGAGGTAVTDCHSVATTGGASAAVAAVVEHFGRIDAVINNAGIIRPARLEELDLGSAAELIQVHLMGTLNVCSSAFRFMKTRGYGRIVNITSGAGLFGAPTQASYSAAKLGIVGLTKVIALEGGEFGIKANCVSPSAVTRMRAARSEAEVEDLGPERVSQVVSLLAHEECPISGEVLGVSGRHVARAFVGLTPGWTAPDAGSWTAESVLEHLDRVLDPAGYLIPNSFAEYRVETLAKINIS